MPSGPTAYQVAKVKGSATTVPPTVEIRGQVVPVDGSANTFPSV